MHGPRPCHRPGGRRLKTLFVGLCALVLVAQAAAVAKGEEAPDTQRTAARPHHELTLHQRLERKLAVARKQRSVIRFFMTHRRLLSSKDDGAVARRKLFHSRHVLATTTRQIARLRRAIHVRKVRLLAAAPPRRAICATFRRYCNEAIEVAWCESRLRTTAHNGQYLGLFQMGELPRRLFGHGSSAFAQSVAAHRYFVVSGRDWSPWSCKP